MWIWQGLLEAKQPVCHGDESDEGLLVCIKCSRSLIGLNLLKMLLDSPDAPLEQAYLTYKIGSSQKAGNPNPH